jgi:F0F1-type ATP synthase membrane subunit b/b'
MNSEAQLYVEIATWSQVVSSIVFIAVLVWMWFKWLLPVFLKAQEQSNRQIAEAERHRDEVKAALDALHSEITTAEHDADLIKQRAADQAEHERQAALDEANGAGNRALRNAGGELERARAAAAHRLRDEVLDKALRLARTEAAQRVDAALNAKLIDRFISGLSVEETEGARGRG